MLCYLFCEAHFFSLRSPHGNRQQARTKRTPNCRWKFAMFCSVLIKRHEFQHNQILMNLFLAKTAHTSALHGRVCFMLFRAIYAVTFYCRCCKALSYFFTLNNKNVSECRQKKGEIKKYFSCFHLMFYCRSTFYTALQRDVAIFVQTHLSLVSCEVQV